MISRLKDFVLARNSEDWPLIRRILAENTPRHWKGYAIAIAMTSVVAACTSATAYLVGSVVNATYLDRSFSAVAALSVAMIVLFSVRGLATYGHAVLVARVGNRITAETQGRVFDKLLQQGVENVTSRRSTEYMANAVVGAPAMASIMNMLVLAVGRDLLSIIGLVGLMIWQDPFLTFACLTVLPVALFGVQKLLVRVRHIAATQYSGSARMLGTMQETVQGFRIVKAFNLEGAVRKGVTANISSLERASNRMARVSNRSAPLVEALGGVAIGIACVYGGYRVLETNAAPGEFITFMTAFLLAFDPARRLARLKIDLGGALAAARILFAMFDSPTSEPDDTVLPELRAAAGRIELADVRFGYDTNSPVLRGLSLAAEPGRVTALVGPSGAGKTTVFNLLLRLYDWERGSFTIDGQDARGVSRQSLRSQIAYVGQDIFLFHGTIRENILIGRPGASEAELIAAAEAAFAHDFIRALPLGYDTHIGEAGALLSLGQRQRVAVARALIKDAPIVLLDEPTASLDSESEHHVQTAIRRLCAGKTTLVIAHRLNTIRHADCIHVIEGGRVVESGRHEPLLARNGRYATFFRLQFPDETGS